MLPAIIIREPTHSYGIEPIFLYLHCACATPSAPASSTAHAASLIHFIDIDGIPVEGP